jgi:hypothetical protein
LAFLVGRQLREAERHAARDDRHLVDRIRERQQDREQRVTLLDSRDALSASLMITERRSIHQHLVLGELEVVQRTTSGAARRFNAASLPGSESVPEKPAVPRASTGTSTSVHIGILRVWTARMPRVLRPGD